ncbi:MAG TPA: phosphoglucomutase/phosphomannomutase family protein [Terriglobales bacterium]|jgi:phosphomannomutase|nr:phosphoglucomutase/phosphomannomutase family protein [Terriglobales bacterium]
MSQDQIKFGTDGWRGVIADDFTFENVRLAAAAIASYVLKNEDASKGLVVAYDTRFGSQRFAQIVAETLAAAGIAVGLAHESTPTPALSYAVKHFGTAGGVVVTSSHNPWNWNGVKFKAKYGGSATPSIIAKIEAELRAGAAPRAATPGKITITDFKRPYIEAITKFVDLDRIAKAHFKFAIDAMYGAGRGMLARIFRERGIEFVEIRGEVNPLFPGINPEPIEPHVRMLQETVVREKCHAGFVTDGDADRIGAVAEDGSFVDSHKIYSVLLRWLLERKKWPGEVVRAFNTTRMLDRIAARYGRKLHECGIGFKFICDLMLERDILIGGEESGGIGITRHLPERDGILNSLLLAAVMAEENKTLAQLVADLQREYGPHYYGRLDLHIPDDMKNSAIRRASNGLQQIGHFKILRRDTIDGVKFYLDAPTHGNGAEAWVLLRASGTEPLLRIYSEAAAPELVKEILSDAETFVRG